MKRLAWAVAVVCLFVGISALVAEDTVYFVDHEMKKEQSVRGAIEQETPSGIKLKTKSGVKDIPARNVTQIVYDNKIVAVIDFRRPDANLTKARNETNAAKRADLLKEALVGFQALDTQLRGVTNIHRYLLYRIAQTTALQAKDDSSRLDAAIAALVEAKTTLSDGWEIVPALQLLARLQEEKGDGHGASQTYSDLAEVPGISPEMKLRSQLLGARLLLRVSKFPEAEAKLKQLASALPKDDPQRTFVDVYLAQSQMAQGNVNGVEAKLKAAILSNPDRNLRALAHNFLGDYYRLQREPEQAFWEYLKVDTLYSDDREEHAKALYYLSQLFDKPKNNPARAEACLAKLKSKDYDGTTYQRMAQSDKKTP